ncbi:hypothetical protein [Salinilacihabitans rarus]|nr:hypothetical protein [Salinilacihabitans rarus]
MTDYLLAVAMRNGHDPREAREYPVRDLRLLAMLDAARGGLR